MRLVYLRTAVRILTLKGKRRTAVRLYEWAIRFNAICFIFLSPTFQTDPKKDGKKLIERIIKAHTMPGDIVLDFFGGTGTTWRVALLLNRRVIISELYEKNIPKIEEILNKGITEFNPEEYENIKVEYTENEPLELAA